MAVGSGVLAVWTDTDPAIAAEFEDWYTHEHVPERVAIPGFRAGFRYRALSGAPAWLAWYPTESPAVLASPEYRQRLDAPTPRTERVMPHFRNTVRAVFRVAARLGRGRGGVALTLRLAAAADRAAALDAWLAGTTMPGLATAPGVVGVQLWLAAEAPAGPTAETALRGPDSGCERCLLVEAHDGDAAEAARRAWLAPAALRHAGAADGGVSGVYALRYALHAEPP